jgi:PAS domain-containing protein
MSAFDEFDVCRNILESLLTGVCVVDMQKRIVFWSSGAERITGRLRHEVIWPLLCTRSAAALPAVRLRVL